MLHFGSVRGKRVTMSAKQERRNLWLAVLGSLVLHVVVGLSLAAFNGSSMPLPPDDKPVELTIVDLSATPPPSVRANPPYMETDPAKESADQPKEKTFESNANSIAASTLPATGDAPLPSQEGKDRSFVDLQTQAASLPTEAKQAVPEKQSTPPPQPTAAPTAITTPKPKPSATPKATPVPTAQPLTTPEPDKLAMLTATPPPALRDPEDVEATPPPEDAASPPTLTTRPQPPTAASAYRPEKQATRITGRITDRGSSSVNAVGTPLGRYQKVVSDAIGSRWYYYTKAKMDLATIGTAVVEAEIDRDGKVQGLRLRSNNANESFANICLQSFQEAQIPPIPPDIIATLPEGRLPVTFSFTLYVN